MSKYARRECFMSKYARRECFTFLIEAVLPQRQPRIHVQIVSFISVPPVQSSFNPDVLVDWPVTSRQHDTDLIHIADIDSENTKAAQAEIDFAEL
jgi:hypothetical protein